MKIAVIARMRIHEKNFPFHERYSVDNSFRKLFDALGILLIPVISENNLDEIVRICDGLLITGSQNDVHPKYYGQEPAEGKEYKYDEYPLVKKVVELFSMQNKPILGICAGIQEINVIFGGTLFQEIPHHKLKNGTQHPVEIQRNSFLYEVYKKNKIKVNSYHSQAIQELASGFTITARSEDGIIEGIEKDNIVAVQWHPEVLYDIHLFKEFIDTFFKSKSTNM